MDGDRAIRRFVAKVSPELIHKLLDLRLADNTGLIAALRDSEDVIPCFIFDPRQSAG